VRHLQHQLRHRILLNCTPRLDPQHGSCSFVRHVVGSSDSPLSADGSMHQFIHVRQRYFPSLQRTTVDLKSPEAPDIPESFQDPHQQHSISFMNAATIHLSILGRKEPWFFRARRRRYARKATRASSLAQRLLFIRNWHTSPGPLVDSFGTVFIFGYGICPKISENSATSPKKPRRRWAMMISRSWWGC
jgi:hypothetical protein